MATSVLNHLDFGSSQQIKNVLFDIKSTIPTGVTGQFLFNASTGKFGYFNGTSWVYPNEYSLPTATASVLGGVKVGTTLEISGGVLNQKSGVATAGTYRSVTVDTYGRVTAGSNPTTLSGYGITDAKIANGVITLGSNTITPATTAMLGNAVPNQTTANKILLSTTTGGTSAWSSWSTKGILQTSNTGVVSVKTPTLWGVTFTGDNITTAPNLYIGTTKVQTSSAEQHVTGVASLTIGDAVLSWDSTNKALKLTKRNGTTADIGFWAEGFVSAFGPSATEGGGTDITAEDIISILNAYTPGEKIKGEVLDVTGGGGGLSWTDLQNSSTGHIIDASHLPTNITALPSKVTAVEGTLNSSRSAHYVYAAPSSGSGAPSWRALVASDIPTLTKSKISDFPTTWAWGSISGKPTTISGYGITDMSSQSVGYLYGGTILEDLDEPEFSDSRMNYRKFNTSTLHRPASSDNANGVINCSYGTHGSDGHYGFQLANITNKGRIYFRNWRQGTPSSWETIAFLSDIPSTMALSSITGADDLKAIEALTGTTGFLKKTAANTWSLDITSYATSSALSTTNNNVTAIGGRVTTLEGYFTSGKANDASHADAATNSDTIDGFHVATMPGIANTLSNNTMLAMRAQTIDLSDTSVYSTSNYYPITFPVSRACGFVDVRLSYISSPYQYIDFLVRGASYYGVTNKVIVREITRRSGNWYIGCIGAGSNTNALCCIWLKGGYSYRVISNSTFTAHSDNYTNGSCTYTVGTNPYGGTNTNVTVMFTPGAGAGEEGIGPSTQASAAYMSGSIRINGGIYTNSNITAQGDIRAIGELTGFYSSSDIRLKKDLTTLSLDGDKIASLPLYSYKRTDRNNKQTDGTIAQEVQKLLPNEVYDRGDGYLAMAEGQLGLIFGINAHKEIKRLSERVKKLERLIEDMDNGMERLAEMN